MPKSVDLNLDSGESNESIESGLEARLYSLVSSVNIACGGHAGDRESMRKCVLLAHERNLCVGAHPSFPDRDDFGRKILPMAPDELIESVIEQITGLMKVCLELNVPLRHIKPHGALYNVAADNEEYAEALIESVLQVDKNLVLVGRAGSRLLQWGKESGLRVSAEAFVDRVYERDGSLRARSYSDALITDPTKCVQQALDIVEFQRVQAHSGEILKIEADTLCIHGDSPNSFKIALQVREALLGRGFAVKALNQ